MRGQSLLIGAGFVLCAASWEACGGERVYGSAGEGYEISLPVRYMKESRSDRHGWHAFGLNHKWELSMDVEVNNAKDGDTLRSLFTIPNYRRILERSTVTAVDMVRLNGVRAIKLEFDISYGAPLIKYHQLWYFAIAGGRSYLVSIQGPEDEFGLHSKEIDAIVKSFKILTEK